MISFILSYSALIIAYNYFWFTKSKVYVQQPVFFVCLKCIVFTCTNCHIIIQILDFDFRTRIDALSTSVVLFTNEKCNCVSVLDQDWILKSAFILITQSIISVQQFAATCPINSSPYKPTNKKEFSGFDAKNFNLHFYLYDEIFYRTSNQLKYS